MCQRWGALVFSFLGVIVVCDVVALEQGFVDGLFGVLDARVRVAQERLVAVQLQGDDVDALVEREVEYHGLVERLDELRVAELGLVFGRLDMVGGECRYVGRVGLVDDGGRVLLVDWRAPMARPFYVATTAQPVGVERRRHIRMRGRVVVGVTDEVLSGVDVGGVGDLGVVGESALFRAMRAARTGRMGSIVSTIQREQDVIIRDESRGVMVVEGGPGTGKTAVALHRAAYLLYVWREFLSRTGVLILGPNSAFLEYISQVLPELGETGVVLSTVGELFPGVVPVGVESVVGREVKGSVEMVTILARAVRRYQVVPDEPVVLVVDGVGLEVSPGLVRAARAAARRSGRPHNEVRGLFADFLASGLARQWAGLIGADPLGGENLLSAGDVAELYDDVVSDVGFVGLVDELWPVLDPRVVLAELLSDRGVIARVAGDYDEVTQGALFREVGDLWSASDAALVDELAELIGGFSGVDEGVGDGWRRQVADAQGVLDVLSSSASSDLDDVSDAEVLSAFDVVDAEGLARRQEVREHRSVADRARGDIRWSYGHVIIDEAQELSAMEWRMVMRRCPTKWMTIVGDTAQTGSPAGVDSWAETLGPFVGDRFVTHRLSVNYRTPAKIMAVAERVLGLFAPDAPVGVALRGGDDGVVRFCAAGTDPWAVLPREEGRLGVVIVADSRKGETPGVLGVSDVKGLEFDDVVVVDPLVIVDDSPQGYQDLFVALTRATRSLVVIGELPG